MSDDYLWDGSGEPDPEVERLEKLLAQFRSSRPVPELPADFSGQRRFPSWMNWRSMAAAAAMMLLSLGAWYLLRSDRHAWEVTSLEGTPKVGSSAIVEKGRITVGQWLETDSSSRAKISNGAIGEVNVDPNTRIRLIEARATDHRLKLVRGRLQAAIWAPPRLFSVETPSALAVDLGCVYTLEVDDAGSSLLHVNFGWVSLETNGIESFVPAGALCETRAGIGSGTPYREDASAAFRAALKKLDFEARTPEARGETLDIVLAEAQQPDAFSLWHLLSRLETAGRSRVFDRLAGFVPPPAAVTREGILKGQRQMLDQWWDQLGLQDATWFRLWKVEANPK